MSLDLSIPQLVPDAAGQLQVAAIRLAFHRQDVRGRSRQGDVPGEVRHDDAWIVHADFATAHERVAVDTRIVEWSGNREVRLEPPCGRHARVAHKRPEEP